MIIVDDDGFMHDVIPRKDLKKLESGAIQSILAMILLDFEEIDLSDYASLQNTKGREAAITILDECTKIVTGYLEGQQKIYNHKEDLHNDSGPDQSNH